MTKYQAGPGGRDTKPEQGSERKRCRFPLPAHQGVWYSEECTLCGVHPGHRHPVRYLAAGAVGKAEKQDCSQENQLSGPSILPCHMWQGPSAMER